MSTNPTVLVNPHSNRSFAAEALMQAFMTLTADQAVVSILLRAGVTPEALVGTAWAVKRAAMMPRAVSIKQAATWVLMVVGDRKVRHEIARHVAASKGVPLKQAVGDLYWLARDCFERVLAAVEVGTVVVRGRG
jgi:hypothetical protein